MPHLNKLLKSAGRTPLLLLTLLLAVVPVWGDPVLNDLDMTVEVLDNGDCRITEVRRMSIDDVGTECYIVMGFMNGSTVRDLQVSDETGPYENIGKWDVNASRSRKAGKCGLVTKSDGYELCWGLGPEGERTYTVSYTVTELVRSYDDADGFNFMFVAQNIKPAARHARITFTGEGGKEIPQQLVKMWAFRYDGEIHWNNGTVVAETSSPMEGEQSMIVMLRFEKEFLHPQRSVAGSFEELKERAFEGSDYDTDEGIFSGMDFEEILAILLVVIGAPIFVIAYFVMVWYYRRRAMKDLLWFRDPPYGGSLKKSYDVVNAYSWLSHDPKNLVSALVLKLLSIGALAIEQHYVQPTGLKKLIGGNAKLMQLIAVKPLTDDMKKQPDGALLEKLHDMFLRASGDDLVLQPDELKSWMIGHPNTVSKFMEKVKKKRSIRQCDKDLERVREVLGMKLFLEDFTLANERHATEVRLWKDYLIFAEMFGIAKQVRKDMKQINPEYLRMDEVLRELNDDNNTLLTAVTAAAWSGIRTATKESSSSGWSSFGGGGWASSGGGGGFSGGGSGGGVR